MRSSQKVWTAAGVTAGIDLALALVEDDHGTEIAQTVARWLVLYLRRPGGQTQFAAPVWMPRAKRTSIRRVQEAIEAEPGARTASANWLNVRPTRQQRQLKHHLPPDNAVDVALRRAQGKSVRS